MQIRWSVSLSLLLLQLTLGAARPQEEILESTPGDAEEDETLPPETDDDNTVLEDEADWSEEKNENTTQEKELLEDEDVLPESRIPRLKQGASAKSKSTAAPRSRYPGGVVPVPQAYGYSKFYPSYTPTSYYYPPPYQPNNYVPNGYYPGYSPGYQSNYFPSNPAYSPGYYPSNPGSVYPSNPGAVYPSNPGSVYPSNPGAVYPSNPAAAYPITSPYDYYPMAGVNEYARKHTLN